MCDAVDVCHYSFDGKFIIRVVDYDPKTTPELKLSEVLAYDEKGKNWYISTWERTVYTAKEGNTWDKIFTYPQMAGNHTDGMDFVRSKSGLGLLYVSDMTSNFIGQWGFGDNPCTTGETETGWTEWKRFSYAEFFGSKVKEVEGMGYGPLGHFWVTSASGLYELGGGGLTKYIEPAEVE